MAHRNTSLILKIVLAQTIALLLLFTVTTFWSERKLEGTIKDGLVREAETVMSLVPATFVGPLFDFDYTQVASLAQRMSENEIISTIRVTEGDTVIAEYSDSPQADSGTDSSAGLERDEQPIVMARDVVSTDAFGEDVVLGTVEVTFTTSVIAPQIEESIRFSIIYNLAILLVIIGLNVVMLLRVVSRPIRQTSLKMREIAEGDADLTNRLAVRSRDEVGQLASYFNEFLQNLDLLVVDMRSGLDRTLSIQSDLGANTEETVAALGQMGSSVESTRKQMALLSDTLSSSTEVVETIVSQIQEMLSGVESQGTMVEETTASVSELLASIENVASIASHQKESSGALVSTARNGGEQLQSTVAVISGIERNIDEIRETLDLINGIASQTNLLAMNAAIEAAHAGDAGRGFAVVAEEIRKLAEDSSENSTRIADVLGQIIHGIQEAAAMSAETSEAFAEVDREVTNTVSALEEISISMAEMNSGSREIHSAVANLNDVSQNLVEGAESIRTGSSSLFSAMDQVNNVAQTVDSAMTEIGYGATEINYAMSHVAEMNAELGRNARELDEKMMRFRTSQPAGVVAGTPAPDLAAGPGGEHAEMDVAS